MKLPSLPFAAALLVVASAAPATAQNEVFHFDGTAEFTSRGSTPGGALPLGPKVLLQRIPGDTIGGASAVASITLWVQDQDFTTPETIEYRLRGNDPFAPMGAPAMGAMIYGTLPIVVAFPPPAGAGIVSAMEIENIPAGPVALPFAPSAAVPDADLYSGVVVPAAPLWPADGISVHTSRTSVPTAAFPAGTAGEQMNPLALVPDVTITGVMEMTARLAWDGDPMFFLIAPATGNRSWRIATRFVDDVLQGYASNPAAFTGLPGDGLDPNYGYAGIWPDVLRPIGPDAVGFRARTSALPGASVSLFVSPMLLPGGGIPLAALLGPMGGGTLLIPPTAMIGPVATVPPPAPPVGIGPVATSEAAFGPYPVSPAVAGITVYVQGAVMDPGGAVPFRLTTMTKVQF